MKALNKKSLKSNIFEKNVKKAHDVIVTNPK